MRFEDLFEMPGYSYFDAGNGYSGSRERFNYRIFRQKEALLAIVWYGIYCSEKSEIAAREEFAPDEAGLARCKEWLAGQWEAYAGQGMWQ